MSIASRESSTGLPPPRMSATHARRIQQMGRHPLTRSDDRRAAIVDQLADHVLANGLGASGLRALAGAARTSDRMLLYYFKDKAEIMAAVLHALAARLTLLLQDRTTKTPQPLHKLQRDLLALLLADDLWPYMQLWIDIAARAARGDPVYRAIGEQIGRGFLAWGAAQLDSPTRQAREANAAKLLVTMEGMVLLKSIGMGDVCHQAF